MRGFHLRCFATLCLVCLICGNATASQSANDGTVARRDPVTIPQEDLAAFVDGMLDIQLKRDDAAGAVVLMMQNDRILLSQGYGSADVRRKRPARADETLFRGGQLSMVFVTVAVMQLVERGSLLLDADVNRYLDFKLEAPSGGPITLRHLLTHTAGFEGTVEDMQGGGNGPALPLREYLLRRAPKQVYPAGSVAAFSTYGMALAAYVIQRASGTDFADFVDANVFLPLGMRHTSFAQPLSTALSSTASEGYGLSTRAPIAFEVMSPAACLGVSTTAEDMGRFGSMLLHGGELDGKRILLASSVGQILSRQYGTSDGLPGMGLGLHQIWFNGLHFYGHAGDTAAFHSEFEIEPEHGLVLFVAYNSSGHGEKLTTYSRGELIHGVFDRYYPFHPIAKAMAPSSEEKRAVEGTWVRANDVSRSRLAMLSLLHQLHARVDGKDGSLMVDRFISDRDTVKRWELIAPNLWQQYPQDRVFAIPGGGKVPDRLSLAATPALDLVRVRWFEDARWLCPALLVSLLWLCIVVGASVVGVARENTRAKWDVARVAVRTERPDIYGLGIVGALWLLASLIVVPAVMCTNNASRVALFSQGMAWMQAVSAAIAVAASLVLLVHSAMRWRRGQMPMWRSVELGMTMIVCGFLTWFALHWHLLWPLPDF